MVLSLRLRLDVALTALLMLATTVVGCGDDAAPQAAPAGGETTEPAVVGADLDGEGMVPRIVTEHPIDAPGRPADGDRPAVAIEAEPAAAWVPHLTAGDLEASLDFYRRLGFEVGSRRGDERVELARDGVRLVLVAAPGGAGADGAGADGTGADGAEADGTGADDAEAGAEAAADDAAAAGSAAIVLHLVDEAGGEGGRTIRDPDGHRVALPGGG